MHDQKAKPSFARNHPSNVSDNCLIHNDGRGRALCSDELDTFEIMTYRSLIDFSLVLILSTVTKSLNAFQMGYLRDHFFRNIFHFSA